MESDLNAESKFIRLGESRYGFLACSLLLLATIYPVLGWGFVGLGLWTAAFWSVLFGALAAVGVEIGVQRLFRWLAAAALAAGLAGLACYNLRNSGHDWIFPIFDGLTLLFLVLATGRVLARRITVLKRTSVPVLNPVRLVFVMHSHAGFLSQISDSNARVLTAETSIIDTRSWRNDVCCRLV